MALDVHVVTQGQNDLLDLHGQLASGRQTEDLSFADSGVDGLQKSDGKGGRFAGSGLGLSDDVAAFDDGFDGSLLNR